MYQIDKYAASLKNIWDMRKADCPEGLTVAKTKELVKTKRNEIKRLRAKRYQSRIDCPKRQHPGKYLRLQAELPSKKARFNLMLEECPKVIGNTGYRANADESVDWYYYPKSYGRPKVTVTNRRVEQIEFDPVHTYKVTASVPVDHFAGKYLIKAIAKMRGIRAIKRKGVRAKLCLTPWHRVKSDSEINGVKIYQRFFAGQPVDYAAALGSTVYHDTTTQLAAEGVVRKVELAKNAQNKRQIVNYELAEKLGFCDAGIKEFCLINGLDIKGEITKADLRVIIRNAGKQNAQFRSELKTLLGGW